MEALQIVGTLLLSLGLTLSSVLVFFYSERKGSAFIQDRLGPTHVGKYGLLQPLADLLKLLHKELVIPAAARSLLFVLAPMLVFAAVFTGFAFVPVWNNLGLYVPVPGGLLLLLGVLSIDSVAILMASYASQSKFPLIAAGRAVAQMVSYEIPIGMVLLCFFWISGSAELAQIETMQYEFTPASGSLISWPWSSFGMGNGLNFNGMLAWNIFQYPILILLIPVFYLCILAESNRAPFDIPEGESEIIGGFHTEYSGFLWAVFFLAEYAMMLVLSLIMSYLFFGGGASPFPSSINLPAISNPSSFWLIAKSWALCLSMIWVRWTLPRLRVDQLMMLSWKILTPVSLLVFLFCALVG